MTIPQGRRLFREIWINLLSIWCWLLAARFAHLDEGPIRPNDLDDDHHGDADHGGQGQSPAYSNGPVRILVHLVVRQWLVFDQREDKAALWWKRNTFKSEFLRFYIQIFVQKNRHELMDRFSLISRKSLPCTVKEWQQSSSISSKDLVCSQSCPQLHHKNYQRLQNQQCVVHSSKRQSSFIFLFMPVN